MSKFKPSKYQQAIYDFMVEGEGNAIVNAVAGSGKSTTIVNSLNLVPEDKKALFLAFNKSIVEELKIKVGFLENVQVSTLHSLGARAINRYYRVSVDANKYSRFIREYFSDGGRIPSDVDRDQETEFKNNIQRLVDLARVNLCDTEEEIYDLADKYEMILVSNEPHYARRFILWGLKKEDMIDFTDMIYWPIAKDLWMAKHDWVFIDECQDLNAAQREMVLKSIEPKGGRFIAVGDPHQAIYGFAGADINSFNLLRNLPNVQEFPLSVCYRCDRAIIELAQKLVPQISAREGAPEGVVTGASYKEAESGDMVLCRFTMPLTKLCMRLISEGTKAHIMGKDIGKNLITMIEKTKKTNMDVVFESLQNELYKIADRTARKAKITITEAKDSPAYVAYEDRMEAIWVLSEGCESALAVIKRIDSIFSDDSKTGIILATIHKSKGLEADRVFILLPDQMHSTAALKLDWARPQEFNLEYVAYTRAKHYLGFINDFEI